MAGIFKTAPRIFETSITTGTGDLTLAGAITGYQSFASGIGNTNFCEYFMEDGTNWEEGIGTVLTGPNRLQRTTVTGSSNGGALVNWGAGTRNVYCGKIAAFGAPRALSKAVGGGAGTTVLTQDEQRRTVIEFTGALTGNRVVEVDATPWSWTVVNNTTGNFTLTFKVTGQTGIALASGARQSAYCNGTDVFSGDLILGAAAGVGTTFLGADVLMNATGSYFSGPNTGSIGGVGQKWLLIGVLTVSDVTQSIIEATLNDGAGAFADTSVTLFANTSTTITIAVVVSPAAPTTYTLKGRNQTTTTGNIKTTGNAGTANQSTSITAIRLS